MKNSRLGSLTARQLISPTVVFLLLLCCLPIASVTNAPALSAKSATQTTAVAPGTYRQTNLVSDLPGVGLIEDPILVGPWGAALSSNSPFWVLNQTRALATLYIGDVSGSPLVRNPDLNAVAVPGPPTFLPIEPNPVAVVANTTSDFVVSGSQIPAAPAQFIFSSELGVISAWQPNVGKGTVVERVVSGASYTGLAIASNASGNLLFAADFQNGRIDVFDKDFNTTSVSGNFDLTAVPTHYHPFNIQFIGGSLYVTYRDFGNGVGGGYVRKFDTNGVRDPGFAIDHTAMSDPWGLAIAPASFGAFANMLLVGNFSSSFFTSSINAFDPATGSFIGPMVEEGGVHLRLDRLGGLVFGNGVNAGDPNTLYFAAGIFSQQHGLFGSLKPASPATSLIRFSDANYSASENAGHIDITVIRTGDTSGTATVNYATVDGSGNGQKSEYEIALGKLTFNPGESGKTFRVLIVDDKDPAGGSGVVVNLVLSNATGAGLTNPTNAQLFIMDDEGDTPGHPPNTSDDPQLFVRQHYFDFLNREPDAAGLDFWVNQITSCGTDQQCIELRRINVSAAFFLSIEFQSTGMLAYLTEKAASGELPRYGAFMRDVQALQKDYVFGAPGAGGQLEANKQAFFDEFVTRPEFVAQFAGLSNQDYVFALFANAELATTTAEVYIARLNGAQVVPPSGSPATGVVVLRQSVNEPVISISLSFSGLTSAETEAHLHGPAAADANAPFIVTLPNGQFVKFQTFLTNPQFLDLSRGRLYVDVHTTNFSNGEIRGQLPSNRFVTDMITRSLDAGIITRAQALRLIAESDYFRMNEFNRAFVLMEYFGYLRRNPDDPPDNNLTGFNFWLGKLNQFNGNFVNADMVKAFIKSTEYRGRFGPP